MKARIRQSLFLVVLALLLGGPALAKERRLYFLIPVPQGKFPPPWTDSIRVSVTEDDDVIQDHRHYTKGTKVFRGMLEGVLQNKGYSLEILCMGKKGKPIAVFQQKVTITPTTKKLELKALKYVETVDKEK